jgi:GWxTD domain-containing protein
MIKESSSFKTFFFVPALFCMFIACTGTKDLSVVNLSNVYRNTDHVFHPDFLVQHLTDSTSRLHVQLIGSEFLFSRQSDNHFNSFFTIRYRLAEAYESINVILDSGRASFRITEEEKNLKKIYQLPILLPKKSEMLLLVTIHDLLKNYEEEFYVPVDNSSSQSRQSFTLTLLNDSVPAFRNYIGAGDSVRINYRDPSVKKYFVGAYNRNFPLAPPPFSFDQREDINEEPDSVFTYDVTDTGFISLKKQGFYHFRIDSTDKNGFTLFVYHHSFPSVTSPEQMLECVRYITARREFEEMKTNPNKRAAMDKFWLDLGGNPERTKVLIKKYYTRIREANQYFSSYTEGWRTDRGLVYTVFGKPNAVYKSSTAENWIYGTQNSPLSVNFLFNKIINPFTDNDYVLTREPLLEGSWMRAVDVWRQGRVYNDN